MQKSPKATNEDEIKRKIKEGRGLNSGKNYRPWLYVQEVASQGRSHRIYSHKTSRTHHLLSDLELAIFLILEWAPSTVDIREQFPLRRDDTRAIAHLQGIRHPGIRGCDHVMSSDFLVDCASGPHRQFAIQAKTCESLSNSRTIEKLEIERRYWIQKQIPWHLITEREINPIVKKNIEWIYPSKDEEARKFESIAQLPSLRAKFSQSPDAKVIDVCKRIDSAYNLELGESLRDIRTFIANGFIKFNVQKPFQALVASELTFCQDSDMETLKNVGD
jgi:hypothetical protein